MNLREEINKLKDEGYSQQNAQARICQDITTKIVVTTSITLVNTRSIYYCFSMLVIPIIYRRKLHKISVTCIKIVNIFVNTQFFL